MQLGDPVTKSTKAAFVNDIDIDDLETLDSAPTVMAAFPAGFISEMQGWPRDQVRYLWLFANDEDAARLGQVLRGESDEDLIPIFDPRQLYYGARPAIDSVFHRGKASKGLIAAVRYIVREPLIYIDFMSVRPGWRRRGINSALLRTLRSHHRHLKMVFSEPTDLGQKFIAATGGEIYPKFPR